MEEQADSDDAWQIKYEQPAWLMLPSTQCIEPECTRLYTSNKWKAPDQSAQLHVYININITYVHAKHMEMKP